VVELWGVVTADHQREAAVVGAGDTTSVGAGICGSSSGCVAVYQHAVKGKDDVASNDE
jgi:hypothetical protein